MEDTAVKPQACPAFVPETMGTGDAHEHHWQPELQRGKGHRRWCRGCHMGRGLKKRGIGVRTRWWQDVGTLAFTCHKGRSLQKHASDLHTTRNGVILAKWLHTSKMARLRQVGLRLPHRKGSEDECRGSMRSVPLLQLRLPQLADQVKKGPRSG
jgi:hypothetical protein